MYVFDMYMYALVNLELKYKNLRFAPLKGKIIPSKIFFLKFPNT